MLPCGQILLRHTKNVTMSIKTKLKKTEKSTKKAEGKLLKLVSAKAKKKKILKQVNELQGLEKQKSSLKKRTKAKSKIASKRKVSAPKKALLKRVPAKKKPKAKKVKANTSKPTAKKLVLTQPPMEVESEAQIDAPKVEAAEIEEDNATSVSVSTDYNGKDAIRQLNAMQTAIEVNDFVVGESRITVLARAKFRIKTITAE
jgi:hypothetical protein